MSIEPYTESSHSVKPHMERSVRVNITIPDLITSYADQIHLTVYKQTDVDITIRPFAPIYGKLKRIDIGQLL